LYEEKSLLPKITKQFFFITKIFFSVERSPPVSVSTA